MFEDPYRMAKIEVLESSPAKEPSELVSLRNNLTGAIQLPPSWQPYSRSCNGIP